MIAMVTVKLVALSVLELVSSSLFTKTHTKSFSNFWCVIYISTLFKTLEINESIPATRERFRRILVLRSI